MSDLVHLMVADAPEPVAPFSHAVRAGRFLFVTGQMPTAPGGGTEVVPGGIVEQTRQVMANLKTVLAAAGGGLEHAAHVRVYLTHFERDYAAMNETYAGYFPPDRRPARTCIGVSGLAVGALVEIDLVALLPG